MLARKSAGNNLYMLAIFMTLPAVLPLPPDSWDGKFDLLAKECGMNESLDQAMEIVDHFYRKAIASDSLSDALLS